MENLADALRIAAGVLLAILLVSTMVYVFRQITIVEDERQQQILVKQVVEFNNMFLAYDKTHMYGTDVMSVISLAINNNKDRSGDRYSNLGDGKFEMQNGHPIEGYVNIKVSFDPDTVQTKKSVLTIDYTKDLSKPENKPEPVYLPSDKYFDPSLFKNDNGLRYVDLSDPVVVGLFNNMIIDNTNGIKVTKQRKNHGLLEIITTEDNIGFNDFKKSIFECTDIKYTDSGRIYEMTFVCTES